MGEEGFSSDSSLLYHRGVPQRDHRQPVWELADQSRTPNHPLKPRHLKLHDLETGTCPVEGRRLVLGNNDVRIAYVLTGTDPSPLYRNAIGDECVYVESGTGHRRDRLRRRAPTAPATTSWSRARPTTAGCPAEPSRLYAIEANSHIHPPKRYLSRFGQLLEHAPYCERDLHGPTDLDALVERSRDHTDVDVLVKHRTSAGIVGTRTDLRDAPVRRRRLGRLPLPLHVQHRRLHADHRQGPPAAAGAPGLRGLELRDLQLPAPQGRLPRRSPSRCPTTTPTSTPTRSCSTSAATTRHARDRASTSARSACTPAATRTARSPAPSRPRWARTTSTSRPSWSTPSRPLDLGEGGLAVEDPAYAWTWAGRGPDADGGDGGPAVYSNS